MKVAAVICELNPFHNGHALLFRKLREEYGADHIIAVMSGNYVQRGEPAVFDKYVRAKMALLGDGTDEGGHADLVLELPPLFAAASAHEFAAAGVHLASATGVVDILGFGTEAPGSLANLSDYAGKLDDAENGENGDLQQLLASGLSYPAALSSFLGKDALTPNNILAVEYLRALEKVNGKERAVHAGKMIRPVAILRQGDAYHDRDIHDPSRASASALRRRICESEDFDKTGGSFPYTSVPAVLHPLYRELVDGHSFVKPDDLSLLLSDRLLSVAADREKTGGPFGRAALSEYLDVSAEIAGRLYTRAQLPMRFTERASDTKTRQYTYSRISRALLHLVLGITHEEFEIQKAGGYIRYIRILGLRRDAAPLLHAIKEKSLLPVISKPADHKDLLHRDMYFDQIYYSILAAVRKTGSDRIRSELERTPVVI